MFRMLVAEALGGLEVHPEVMVSTLSALAAGDAAAAWCVMTGATTSLLAAYLDPSAAKRMWQENPSTITAGVFAPMGRAKPVDGGYRLTGRWPFASGCENATWRMGGGLVIDGGAPRALADGRPEVRSFFFPASESEVIDTWDVMGLCGTGSHDLEVKDVFVPAEHTACVFADAPKHDGALFKFPIFGLLAAGVAACGLGIGRAAMDSLGQLAKTKKGFGGSRSIAQQDLVQVEVASAEGELRAGEALLLQTCRDTYAAAERGELTLQHRASLRLAANQATRAAVRATDAMYHAGGGTSLYRKSPLQRHFRDVHAVTQHIMVSQATDKTVGRVLLDLETDVTQL